MPYCLFVLFCFPINVELLPCVYMITVIVIANIIVVIINILLDHLKSATSYPKAIGGVCQSKNQLASV